MDDRDPADPGPPVRADLKLGGIPVKVNEDARFAIAEGICPECAGPLQPRGVRHLSTQAQGFCESCRIFWILEFLDGDPDMAVVFSVPGEVS